MGRSAPSPRPLVDRRDPGSSDPPDLSSLPLSLDPPITSLVHWSTSSTRPDLSVYNFSSQTWRKSAACIGYPNDLFFPPPGVSGEPIRDVCFSCPVRLDCLDYALHADEQAGWFGGHPYIGRRQVARLVNKGHDLETADAIVLKSSLHKMRRKRAS